MTRNAASPIKIIRVVLGIGLLLLALVLPQTPADLRTPDAWLVLPLLLPIVVLLLGLCRGAASALIDALVALAATLLVVIKLLDVGTLAAYNRVFDPVVDMGLLPAAWHLAAGTFGTLIATGLAVLIAVALLLFAVVLFWGLAALAGSARRPAVAILLVAVIVAAGALLGVQRTTGAFWGVQANTVAYVGERVSRMQTTYRRLAEFDRSMARDPIAKIPVKRLFSALAGKNVMVIFVESYGRNAVEGSRYAPTIVSRLARVQAELSAAGEHAASAWVTSPTMGGMSWLAHGALLSGLWTNDQKRYDAMIASDRASLNRLFKRAGWTTIAAMPAISMAWPEAAWFDYDHIYDAHHLGYKGKPFNWVTMPDQYTLLQIHRIVAQTDRPAMVETALISSHAPWTPIPHMVPWGDVGDGRIFNPQTERGDSPQVVWADPKRVREQYLKSVDYSLTAIGSFIAHYGDNTVFIILGDHQPAPVVTGHGVTRDVPMHIVTDDPAVLDRLNQKIWTPGMKPAHTAPAIGMDRFRARFVRAMSGPRGSPDAQSGSAADDDAS